MFEQATLSNGPASKRAWTAFAGITTQAIVVTGLLLGPVLFPQTLPKVALSVPSVFTLLRGSKPEAKPGASRIIHVRPIPFHAGGFFLPRHVPEKVMLIDDTDVGLQSADIAGTASGIGSGPGAGVFGALPTLGIPVAPIVHVVEAPKGPPPIVTPIRVPIGGMVKQAQILRRIEPAYPPLAKQARISGTVELEGIIGVDGRMIDLRIKSGHPLLTKAAYDAVIQWIYQPTTLNGKPVEVIAPITVTFRLN